MGLNLSRAQSGPPVDDPAVGSLRQEIEALRSRIVDLEIERDEYAQQNSELFVLQQVFSTINSTLEIDDILSMVLRGVCEALKFHRVILFDVLPDGEVVRRLEGDSSGSVAPAADPRELPPKSALHEVARGEQQVVVGFPDDDLTPLIDTKGSYCIAPLVARGIVRGLLYIDGPPCEPISEKQVRVLLDFASQAAIAVENARLYDETKRLLEETQRLALTDHLTGLPNRRALNEMLERELSNSERYNSQFAFMILDMDDLKKINDSGGHSLGDLALKRFAEVLRKGARKGDIIARYAGDEFILVMARSDRNAAERGVGRLLTEMRGRGLPCSIGIAMFPSDGTQGQTLFFAADEALYRAKQSGKNQSVFYERAVGNPPANVSG